MCLLSRLRIAGGEATTTVGKTGRDDCDCNGKETPPPSRFNPLEDEMDCFCRLVLDQAWDGPVDQVAAIRQVVEVHPFNLLDPSRWPSA